MKTLEDIMRGVTPPETWQVKKPGEHGKGFRLVHPVGVTMDNGKEVFAAIAEISPSRSSDHNYDERTEKARALFLARAARNFVPIVKALEGLLDVAWPNESQPDSRTNKAIDAAKSVLNQALADEP